MSDDIEREEANGHSLFGASKSARFLSCPGSLRAEMGRADTAGYFAAEGTVAHSLADEWLRTGVEPAHRVGETVSIETGTGTHAIPIDATMLAYVGQYVEWCFEAAGDQYFEQRVDYSRLTPIPGQGGTADFFACRPGHLTLRDFKFGVAEQIFAKENPQVMLYALGVIYEWDWLYEFERVTISICQPRLGHFDTWETTKAELLEFAEVAKAGMHAAWEPNAPRVPSEKACKYCKAKIGCPALGKAIDDMVADSFAGGALEAPGEGLPTDRLLHVLSYQKLFEKYFSDCYKELERRARTGEKVPGWMLAEGKASRRVADPQGVVDTLGAYGLSSLDAWKVAALSPAELEQLLVVTRKVSLHVAKKAFSPFVVRVPGKAVFTTEGPGKRPAKELPFDDATETVEL